jgi:hypothetical protein
MNSKFENLMIKYVNDLCWGVFGVGVVLLLPILVVLSPIVLLGFYVRKLFRKDY